MLDCERTRGLNDFVQAVVDGICQLDIGVGDYRAIWGNT